MLVVIVSISIVIIWLYVACCINSSMLDRQLTELPPAERDLGENPAVDTVLQPLIWCFKGWFSHVCSSPVECVSHRHRYDWHHFVTIWLQGIWGRASSADGLFLRATRFARSATPSGVLLVPKRRWQQYAGTCWLASETMNDRECLSGVARQRSNKLDFQEQSRTRST